VATPTQPSAAPTAKKVKFQIAHPNRSLDTFPLMEGFAKRVGERTNGQVEITLTSYPELGITGFDLLRQVQDGTIPFAVIYSGFVGGDFPLIEMGELLGLFPDSATQERVFDAIRADEIRVMREKFGGEVLFYEFYPDQFFFSKKPLNKLEDFKGVRSRSHSVPLGDLIKGLGAEPQTVTFAEVYTALERGILDAGVTGSSPGYGQRWYEVTKYLVGPLKSHPHTMVTINRNEWNKLPADVQQIMREEGAKTMAENRRLVNTWDQKGVDDNVAKGMIYSDFTPEMRAAIRQAVLKSIVPNWAKRAGGPNSEAVKIFNDKVAPIVGLKILADGSVEETTMVKAPTAAMTPIGGPGAIYRGKLEDLVGLATRKELGDEQGGVSLDSLKRYTWIYESDYYKKLIEKAKLDDPTPLVTKGKKFKLQWVPITRAIQRSKLMEDYFIPNVLKRTDGQVEITISSYPELGIAGPDTLRLVADGTIGFIEIYGGYVAGEFPLLELGYLWGLFPDDKTLYTAVTAFQDDVDRLTSEEAGGAKIVLHGWAAEGPLGYFSKKPLRTTEDFKGMKFRSHSTALSDWVIGMGGEPQFMAFAEVYTGLERGIIDAGSTSPWGAYGQRWYEVVDYIVGPIASTFVTLNQIINKKVWDGLPPDIQQILLEEGAKYELETLRLAPAWNESGIPALQGKGMELVEFSPELKARSFEVALERVIPQWVKRLGGPDTEGARIFNEKITPLTGVKINPDGTASKTIK